MDSAGMMKMASGDGIPLRQGAGTGLDWFSVATEASGGGTPDLFSLVEVLGYIGIYGCRRYVGGPKEGPRGRGRAPGGWARPYPRELLLHLLTLGPSLSGRFPSKNNFSS